MACAACRHTSEAAWRGHERAPLCLPLPPQAWEEEELEQYAMFEAVLSAMDARPVGTSAAAKKLQRNKNVQGAAVDAERLRAQVRADYERLLDKRAQAGGALPGVGRAQAPAAGTVGTARRLWAGRADGLGTCLNQDCLNRPMLARQPAPLLLLALTSLGATAGQAAGQRGPGSLNLVPHKPSMPAGLGAKPTRPAALEVSSHHTWHCCCYFCCLGEGGLLLECFQKQIDD